MRLRRRRLLLPLLLALAATTTTLTCRGAQAAARRSSPGSENEPRVKLCGRDLVRAVIFTCGGSRWKRVGEEEPPPPPREATTPEPLPGSAGAEFVPASSENGLKNINPQSLWDFKLERLQSGSRPASQQSLRDLYNLYDDYDYVPVSGGFSDYPFQIVSGMHNRGETRLVTSMESHNFPWSKYPRRKRNTSMGVAAMCCKWGCTEREISVLC